MFTLAASDYTTDYRVRGFIHARDGVDPGFLAEAQRQAAALMSAETDLTDFEIKGKKLQYLFEVPDSVDWPGELFTAISTITGLPLDPMTLCERHIKAYVGNAPAQPPAHKDRAASEVTIGIPLVIPDGSYLQLYPEHHLEENPFATTALWRTSLDEDQLPERVLADIEPVTIDAQPGDVVVFAGSRIYHERLNPANAVVLYLKLNARRIDPLGEDPRTAPQREHSLALLASSDDAALASCAVEVSPRLDQVVRLYSRLDWREVLQARIWGGKEFGLEEWELDVIRAADGVRTIGELLHEVGATARVPDPLSRVRRLVHLQALDLVVPQASRTQRTAGSPEARSRSDPALRG